jgi:hypothetical protein
MASVPRLPFDVARETIRQAFRPLDCIVHTHACSDRVSFQIYDAERIVVYASDKLVAAHLCSAAYLRRVVNDARSRVEAVGFKLNAWNPPS